MTNQLIVGCVGHLTHVVGATQKTHEPWGLIEQLT